VKIGRSFLTILASACLIANSQVPLATGVTPKSTLKILKVKSPEKDFPIRSVYVFTPAVSPDEVDLLPVVYMLHGWPGSPNGLMAGLETPLETAFAKGASPFIAVFPDGNALTHSDSEWADSFDGRAMIETWLTTSVEARNIRSREDRAILGFSMGGYGAAIIGLHHPELFSQVVTLAGYFVIDDLTNAFGPNATSAKKQAYQTPTNYLKSAKKIRWFLGESRQDFTQLIRGQAAAWSAKLKSIKAPYSTSSANGGHSYVFVNGEVPIIAKWFKWGTVTLSTPSPSPSASASASASA
jgi:S-formylglutathione hydrolase FrmB